MLNSLKSRITSRLQSANFDGVGLVHFAEPMVRLVARLNPTNAKLLDRSGWLSLKVGRNAAALKSIRAAIRLEPDDWLLQRSLIRALVSLGAFQEAEVSATRALQRWPEQLTLLELRAASRDALGDVSGAHADVETIARICETTPTEAQDFDFFRVGAHALLRLNKNESAENLLQSGLAQYGDHPTLTNILAQSCAAQGRRNDAITLWRQVLKQDPANATATTALASNLIKWSRQRKVDGLTSSSLVDSLTPGDPMSDILSALPNGPQAALSQWRAQRSRTSARDVPSYSRLLADLFKLLMQLDEPGLIVAIGGEESLIVDNSAPSLVQRQAIRVYIRALIETNETKKARALLTRESYFQPESEEDQASFAELLLAEQRVEECLASAQRTAAQFPNSSRAVQLIEKCLAYAVSDIVSALKAEGHAAALRKWRAQKPKILPQGVLPSYSKMLRHVFKTLTRLGEPSLIVAIGNEENLIVDNSAPSFTQREAIGLYIRALVGINETEKARTLLTNENYFRPEYEQDQSLLAELLLAELGALSDGEQGVALRKWRELRIQFLSKDEQSYSETLRYLIKLLRQRNYPGLLIAIGSEEELIVNNPAPSFAQREAISLFIRTLIDMHMTKEARAFLTNENYFQPDSEEDQASLAELLFAERRFEECLESARRTAVKFPNSSRAHRMVARCLAVKRDHTGAGQYIESLYTRRVLNGVQLGKIALLTGQTRMADELLRNSFNPKDVGTVKAYTDFLRRMGRWKDIQSLGARYENIFDADGSLRTILEDAQTLSRALDGFGEPEDDINASVKIYDEVLRCASTVKASPKPLRIAMVIGTLGPGGAERQCAILCRELAQRIERGQLAELRVFVGNLHQSDRESFHQASIEKTGTSVVQYYQRSERANPFEVIDDNTTALLLDALQPPIRQQQILQLYTRLKDFEPDIVHAWLDSAAYIAGLSTALLPTSRLVARWGSLPPTVQRVSSDQECENASILRDAYSSLIRRAKVQFYSNARLTADTYAEWIGVSPSQIKVVKNGMDFSSFRPDAQARAQIREELDIPQDATVIGTTIRLGSEKRPFMWLDIADRVAAKCDNAAFIIVGDGPLLEDVQAKAKELANAKVHLVGRQSNVSDWYSAMDVNLMTSSVEGLSNTILESSYMSLPVVAYDVGGMSEAVENGQTGFLLEEGDVEGMADALVRLVKEPELRQAMGEKGHAFVAESFDPNKMCDSVLEIYDELLKR